MKKYVFLGVVCAVLLLLSVTWVLAQNGDRPPVPDPKSDDPVERGSYLFRIGFGCMGCHRGQNEDGTFSEDPLTSPATGGVPFELPFGTAYAANMTLLGDWSDDDIELAIRYGVGPGNEGLAPIMAFHLYESMSDQDMADIIAFLRSLEPAGEEPPEIAFTDPNMSRDMFLFQGEMDLKKERPAVDASDPVARGAYLANQASCMHCHGVIEMPSFTAAPYPDALPWGTFGPPLLHFYLDTVYPTTEDLKNVLKTGTRPDGSVLSPDMPWMAVAAWPEEDIDAIVAWMKSLPEVDPADNPVQPMAEPPTEGELDGAALVDERCTLCHSRDTIDSEDMDEAGWTETVDEMIENGAVLNDEERAAVIKYLVETH